MRPGQNFYYAQHQQQAAQVNSGFRPGQQHHQHQQNPAFLPSLYAGPHDLHSGVQVVALPIGQQFAVTPIPPPQQWGHLRSESPAWGSGNFPSQGLGPPFHGQQFMHHEPNVAFIPPQHLSGDGLRGNSSWGYGQHDGPSGRFDRNPTHQDVRRPLEGMRQMDYLPHERSSRGSSRDKSYDDNRSGSWSNGSGSSNSRNISGGKTGKGRGGGGGGAMDREPMRPQAISLHCEPCDRTLSNAQQFAAHKSTHVKCDVPGCSFEASGRVVKEHKQTSHDSVSSSAPSRPGLFKSKESEEEVLRWRDERKRNYPTTANIKHKAEEMQARKARGELVDEDARKRRERLKEILARQAELGVPVAELPAYYLSDRYGGSKDKNESGGGGRKDNNRNGKRRLNADQGSGTAAISDTKEKRSEPPLKQVKIEEPDPPTFVELAPTTREPEAGGPGELKIPKAEPTDEPDSEAVAANAGGKGQDSSKKYTQVCYFFKRGRCKKGNRCEFLHDRRSDRPKKTKKDLAAAANNKRQPSLLAKLLESDIRREKSHLLQSFRFFVNNMFLLEWPEKPLKFFDWTDVEDQANSENEVARIDKKLQEELEAVMEDTDEEEDDEEVGRVVTPREEEHGNGESSMQLEAAQ